MKKSDIKVNNVYIAKVSNKLTEVRVDKIYLYAADGYHTEITVGSIGKKDKGKPVFYVTNLKTGRDTQFRSAAKFRKWVRVWKPDPELALKEMAKTKEIKKPRIPNVDAQTDGAASMYSEWEEEERKSSKKVEMEKTSIEMRKVLTKVCQQLHHLYLGCCINRETLESLAKPINKVERFLTELEENGILEFGDEAAEEE